MTSLATLRDQILSDPQAQAEYERLGPIGDCAPRKRTAHANLRLDQPLRPGAWAACGSASSAP